MGWILQRSIKQMDVIRLLRKLDLEHSLKGVNVRNDNGSQFSAHRVRFFLRSSQANQEFTHIATLRKMLISKRITVFLNWK